LDPEQTFWRAVLDRYSSAVTNWTTPDSGFAMDGDWLTSGLIEAVSILPSLLTGKSSSMAAMP
jgi:hypothetical protein